MRLRKMVENYNEIKHSGTGLSPTEAMNPEQWTIMRKQIYLKRLGKYQEYARKVQLPKFVEGQMVYTQVEVIKDKQDLKYIPGGIIAEVLERDTYLVRRGNKYQKYHASQLRH